jgi:hypothetical protein
MNKWFSRVSWVTTPTIPVSTFGHGLLTGVASQLTHVLPYAAAFTAFAIGVLMLKRWLGHESARGMAAAEKRRKEDAYWGNPGE